MNLSMIAVGIFLAALFRMVLGMFWYSPLLFGSRWLQLSKATPNQDCMIRAVIIDSIASLIMAALMACFMSRLPITTIWSAINFGWMTWLAFVATTLIHSIIYEGKPFELYLINVFYLLIAMVGMAKILFWFI